MTHFRFSKKTPLLIVILVVLVAIFVYAFRTPEIVPAIPLVIPSEKPIIKKEEKSSVLIYPEQIVPGDPVFITTHSTSTVSEILFDGKKISLITYNGLIHGLTAIDFNEKVLKHQVVVKLVNGEVITVPIVVTPREKIEKPLGIPDTLGGNTTEASKTLIQNLAKENAEINTVTSGPVQLWKKGFEMPLADVFITDDYGYDRKTVGQTIPHKGTDFRAAVGTEVKALNTGVVKIARTYTVYGNTIIIDHGLGVQTLYMHLSELKVKEGDTVNVGDVIGLSGKTGYAEGAHLHVSVKVKGLSIDPMVFLGFWE